jgi:hypothetical protein
MRALIAAAAVTMVAGLAPLSVAAQEIIYQEPFWFTGEDGTDQDPELRVQGWCGGNAGDPLCANGPGEPAPANNGGGEGAISVSAGSGVTPSQDINNDPQGPFDRDNFAFWSQTQITADSFLYTDEYPLETSQLTDVQWDQRSNESVPMHLAFLVDGTWYISDQTWVASDASNWVVIQVAVDSLTFFERATGGDPSTLPGGGVPGAAGGLSLPDGTISAFGVWWDGPKTATSRIDNFILRGFPEPPNGGPEPPFDGLPINSGPQSIPTLGEWFLVLLILASIGVAAQGFRHRRD